jgi:hypothetical protein
MPAATTSVSGYLTSTDWNTFNNKGSGTVTSVTGTAPVVSSGGATPAISMAAASASANGYLTSADWSTFNGKGSGTVTSVGGTGTVNGITLTGTVTSSGSLTLGGTLSGVNLTSQVTGTLPVGNGGIGITTTPSNGKIPIGNGTNYTAATLTAGAGITVTNASGSITIANNDGPAFSAYGNSIQTLSNNTYTKVAYNSSVFDTNSNYSTSNYRFTPTVGGYYQFNCLIDMTIVNVTQLVLMFYKNGAIYENLFGAYNGGLVIIGNSSITVKGASLIYLNGSTDYVETYVYASLSGSSTTVNGYASRPDVNFFNAAMIRGT